jgi:hypothetical protein
MGHYKYCTERHPAIAVLSDVFRSFGKLAARLDECLSFGSFNFLTIRIEDCETYGAKTYIDPADAAGALV